MYKIVKEKCSVCGLCADLCPEDAISQYGEYKINPALCNSCGLCVADCPSRAIILVRDESKGAES